MIYLLAPAIIIALLVELKYLGIIRRFYAGSVEVTRLRTEIMNFRIETKKRDYNARKRDEKLLREIHKSYDQEFNHFAKLVNLVEAVNDVGIAGLAKQCRSINGVARQAVNNDLETRANLIKLLKSAKEAGRVLSIFEETLEKVKKTGRGK
jgi:hypothetical protein